ncbi:MAG: DNRLRE domain-containing protein [Opitutales bacterium]|nr:DNRLRE domain-containing protein [Opitutales bacterium]
MKSLSSSIVATIAILVFSQSAFSQGLVFNGGATLTTAYGAGADTYLSNDTNSGPSVVHGGAASMNMRAIDNSRARLILLRFDLSELEASTLTDATLTLNLTTSTRTRDWNVFGSSDATLNAWDELSTNYNNAPGINSATLGNYSIDTAVWASLGTFNIQASIGQQTSNTTSLNLDSLLTGNTSGFASLLLAFPSGTSSDPDWWVTSKEGDAMLAPTLNLPNAQAIPEPSTYAVIFGGLAFMGVVYLRRRNRKA